MGVLVRFAGPGLAPMLVYDGGGSSTQWPRIDLDGSQASTTVTIQFYPLDSDTAVTGVTVQINSHNPATAPTVVSSGGNPYIISLPLGNDPAENAGHYDNQLQLAVSTASFGNFNFTAYYFVPKKISPSSPMGPPVRKRAQVP